MKKYLTLPESCEGAASALGRIKRLTERHAGASQIPIAETLRGN